MSSELLGVGVNSVLERSDALEEGLELKALCMHNKDEIWDTDTREREREEKSTDLGDHGDVLHVVGGHKASSVRNLEDLLLRVKAKGGEVLYLAWEEGALVL